MGSYMEPSQCDAAGFQSNAG